MDNIVGATTHIHGAGTYVVPVYLHGGSTGSHILSIKVFIKNFI